MLQNAPAAGCSSAKGSQDAPRLSCYINVPAIKEERDDEVTRTCLCQSHPGSALLRLARRGQASGLPGLFHQALARLWQDGRAPVPVQQAGLQAAEAGRQAQDLGQGPDPEIQLVGRRHRPLRRTQDLHLHHHAGAGFRPGRPGGADGGCGAAEGQAARHRGRRHRELFQPRGGFVAGLPGGGQEAPEVPDDLAGERHRKRGARFSRRQPRAGGGRHLPPERQLEDRARPAEVQGTAVLQLLPQGRQQRRRRQQARGRPAGHRHAQLLPPAAGSLR